MKITSGKTKLFCIPSYFDRRASEGAGMLRPGYGHLSADNRIPVANNRTASSFVNSNLFFSRANRLAILVIFVFGFHIFLSPMIPNISSYVFLRHCGTLALIGIACLYFRPRHIGVFALWICWSLLTFLLGELRSGLFPNIASVTTMLVWFPVVYMLSRSASASSDRLFRKAFLLFCIVSSVVAIDQFYAWTNIGRDIAQITEYNEVHTGALLFESFHRVVGFCGNPNEMALIACMGIVAVFSLIRKPTQISLRVVILTLLLFIVTTLFTFSRTGIAAIFCMLFLLIFLKQQRRPKRRVLDSTLVWIGIAACVFIMVSFWRDYLYETFPITQWIDRATLSQEALQTRYSLSKQGLEVLDETPIFGYGFGSIEGQVIVDNGFVYVLRNTGIIGLSIFIFTFYVLPMRSIILSKAYTSGDYSLVLGLAVLLIFALSAGQIIYVTQSGFVAWLWGAADRIRDRRVS
jgi:O-antigen ligase